SRRPGQKEVRYAQLLGGEPVEEDVEASAVPASPRADRIAALEEEVASLRNEMAELRATLDEFRREFQ
ncbi:MAG: DUF480 domain-containing protein, partial [Longimicrobiales bacterium]